MKIKLTSEEIDGAYSGLMKKANFDLAFIFLTISATIICILGFVMDSSPVIIGAMVLSPLLYPVIALSASILRWNHRNMVKLFLFLLGGLLTAIAISAIISAIWKVDLSGSEVLSRLNAKPMIYFLIALFSGMAATFSFYWPGISEAITGIAISIALIPPIVIFGTSIPDNPQFLFSSGLIILLNLIGIFIGSLLILFVFHQLKRKK
ncbi:DUF389 domain-containing protein [Patescibacteria group bacterium]|nr:DUF389 domain-containing protein [Patescibacteria group bacterium]MBU1673524.1 DUF389 domain-containing protein [Patescibacteria group bacterium]MBU1963708.1 DUF389 domain-containing protein [Patescibacteria group bacterium]